MRKFANVQVEAWVARESNPEPTDQEFIESDSSTCGSSQKQLLTCRFDRWSFMDVYGCSLLPCGPVAA